MPTVSRGLYRWFFLRGATLEDFADRLNHFWTFGLLLVLGCVVSWKQGYSDPIQCWTPAHMTSNMADYVNNICWNSYNIRYPRDVDAVTDEFIEKYNTTPPVSFLYNNMPVVENEDIDESDALFAKMVSKRTLYQWLPLIICFQALLFKLPNIIMYIFHSYSGMSFDKLADLTSGYETMQLPDRDVLGRQVARVIYTWCDVLKCLPCRLLTFLWLLVKILYCINIVLQMFALDKFLSPRDQPYDNTTSYGDIINTNIFKNNATLWKISPAFPRQVMCQFSIITLANIQQYAVQCFMPSNQFNEFVYMFIWVWFLFVAIVTFLSAVLWGVKTVVPIFRKRYIKKAFALSEDIDPQSLLLHDVETFSNFVGEDGVMALKIVAANTSEILVSKIVCSMWTMKMRGMAYTPMEYGVPAVQTGTGQVGGETKLYPTSEIKKME